MINFINRLPKDIKDAEYNFENFYHFHKFNKLNFIWKQKLSKQELVVIIEASKKIEIDFYFESWTPNIFYLFQNTTANIIEVELPIIEKDIDRIELKNILVELTNNSLAVWALHFHPKLFKEINMFKNLKMISKTRMISLILMERSNE